MYVRSDSDRDKRVITAVRPIEVGGTAVYDTGCPQLKGFGGPFFTFFFYNDKRAHSRPHSKLSLGPDLVLYAPCLQFSHQKHEKYNKMYAPKPLF